MFVFYTEISGLAALKWLLTSVGNIKNSGYVFDVIMENIICILNVKICLKFLRVKYFLSVFSRVYCCLKK